MTQTERRKYLIAALLKEQPQYSEIEIPTSEWKQKILLRSLFNIRMPLPATDEFLTIQDTYLQAEVRHKGMHILFLELGVGANTPVIIKYPFWQMTAQNSHTIYACINYGEAVVPRAIVKQAICINSDISAVLKDLG